MISLVLVGPTQQPTNRPSGESVFAGLRNQVLSLDPFSVGLTPTAELPRVFGLVMDTTYENGSATVVALADGTASLYTSSGGGVIGSGAYPEVRMAVAQVLQALEQSLDLFDLSAAGGLPPSGRTSMTALTYSGHRSVSAPESDFGESRHLAAPIFHAMHKVIFHIRRSEEIAKQAREAQPDGTTRLMAAAHAGDHAGTAVLLDHGAAIEAHDDQGYTALMYASNAGQDEAVRVLLARGADPNARDRQGSTPLMFAAQSDHVGILRQLLTAGADPNARGEHGLTALGFAQQNGHRHAAEVLNSAIG